MADIVKLEDLTGWVEYDVNGHLPEGDPLRYVARAWVSGRTMFPRREDASYPHPYKPAWNAKVQRHISIRQIDLDNGSVRPVSVE